jgi:hypothetical protein
MKLFGRSRPVEAAAEEAVAPFPHCNTEVLHAPGTCVYCDLYPDRQAQRQASNTPFTPAESNGWYGNVAVGPKD